MKRAAAWLLRALARPFDLLRGPAVVESLLRALTRTSPLTATEVAAGREVLGADAVEWDRVVVANGGLLRLAFRVNGSRAFTTFHTINLPESGTHTRTNVDIIVHELVHVLQFERVGSRYAGEALGAQEGAGYGYGGPDGLRRDRAAGLKLADFNREQQGQIAQDYFTLRQRGGDTSAYDPFIADLRAGDV
ncbi:MAG: hypothetical protein ACRDJV_02650 [Actinomycetota bacterium]